MRFQLGVVSWHAGSWVQQVPCDEPLQRQRRVLRRGCPAAQLGHASACTVGQTRVFRVRLQGGCPAAQLGHASACTSEASSSRVYRVYGVRGLRELSAAWIWPAITELKGAGCCQAAELTALGCKGPTAVADMLNQRLYGLSDLPRCRSVT